MPSRDKTGTSVGENAVPRVECQKQIIDEVRLPCLFTAAPCIGRHRSSVETVTLRRCDRRRARHLWTTAVSFNIRDVDRAEADPASSSVSKRAGQRTCCRQRESEIVRRADDRSPPVRS